MSERLRQGWALYRSLPADSGAAGEIGCYSGFNKCCWSGAARVPELPSPANPAGIHNCRRPSGAAAGGRAASQSRPGGHGCSGRRGPAGNVLCWAAAPLIAWLLPSQRSFQTGGPGGLSLCAAGPSYPACWTIATGPLAYQSWHAHRSAPKALHLPAPLLRCTGLLPDAAAPDFDPLGTAGLGRLVPLRRPGPGR